MNKQEIFDIVSVGMLRQAKKSIGVNGCAYRGPDGLKCAAGMLIPDSLYTPRLENKTADSEIVSKVLCRAGVVDSGDTETMTFVRRLQILHDNPTVSPAKWRECLLSLAEEYALSHAAMDAIS